MASLTYPSARELKAVEQVKLPRLLERRPIFDIFPMASSNYPIIEWEQKDNYTGLMQVRGINGAPNRVNRIGAKRYVMTPGVYGEFIAIDERELTARRAWGTFNDQLDISDLVMEAQDQLLERRLDRIESQIWTLLTTGTFSVTNEAGATVHTDSYTTQTYAASDWGTAGTGTPLLDFRAVQLLGRGSSASFGTQAQAYMNRKTFNLLLANTNANDIGGRFNNLMTIPSVDEINRISVQQGTPTIVVYDEGYLNDAGTFVPFIADDKVIVVGSRPARANLGRFVQTANANNPGMAGGPYTKVFDRGEEVVPRSVEVHDGYNGGLELWFGGAIVVMSV